MTPLGLDQQEAWVFQEIARITQWRGRENSQATTWLIKLIQGMLQGEPFVSKEKLLGESGKFQTLNPQLHRLKKHLCGSPYKLSSVRKGKFQLGWKLEKAEKGEISPS